MKRTLTFAAALVTTLAVAGVAPAQTGDAVVDGNGHPNVGALLAKRTDGSLTIVCSGTLVAPRVFLTAAHCTSFLESIGQSRAYVTFDPFFGTNADRSIKTTPHQGAVVTIPSYKGKGFKDDVGIVVLDSAVAGIAPAAIAPVGMLDAMKESRALYDADFLNVGYGTSEMEVVPKVGPTFPFDGIRKWTISGFHALNQTAIHLNQNLARGFSGTGYGDSGGPTFVQGKVISIVSTGDIPCYATSVNQRTDLPEVHAFLAPYLALR